MAYRNTFFRWLFLYSLTFGLTYVLKLFTYLCPETGQIWGCLETGPAEVPLHKSGLSPIRSQSSLDLLTV